MRHCAAVKRLRRDQKDAWRFGNVREDAVHSRPKRARSDALCRARLSAQGVREMP